MPTLTTTDLRAIQAGQDVVTPREVVEIVRASGREITPRTVSFLQTQQILPPVDRVGSRGGYLPAICVDLIVLVVDLRNRGLRLGAIRELVPLWACLVSGQVRGRVDLAAFEAIARQRSLCDEAMFHVPFLVEHILGGFHEDQLGGTEIALKDGSIVEPEVPLTLTFVFGGVSKETGEMRIYDWSQLSLPGVRRRPNLNDPSVIVLGIPPDADLTQIDPMTVHQPRPTRQRRTTVDPNQEVLPLGL
jgi:DNA-binding transcriptional MerR regulator